MRLLLDTHIFLWAVMGDSALKAPVRRVIEEADEVYVSAASIWEIAIKARLGKIEADADALVDEIAQVGFRDLPIHSRHAAGVAKLPLYHTDPFDRLLIAQAIAEPLKLLTVDKPLAQYSEMVLVV
ncbi:MAG TPA: type II toxin-antitoxin system VapC family toxin [Steroidobacteraceae bacterium]